MAVLRLAHVRRSFQVGGRRTDVLRGVSLVVEPGEFLTIEGPSGSGKSTLLNLIGTLDLPTDGTYHVGADAVAESTPAQLAALRSVSFSFVFQNFHLLDRRPARDSVELGLMYRGVPARERAQIALDALRKLGIHELGDALSNRLSGGERQRVALARALASATPVIIADEPTGNLDAANTDSVVRILRRLNDEGRTIVLVTHSAQVAASGTRRIRLVDGEIVEDQRIRERPLPTQAAAPHASMGGPRRLRLRDLLRDALANLLSRRGRTAGLVAAVALGVALVTGTMGLAESAQAQVTARFDEHTSRDVAVEWNPSALDDQPASMRSSIPSRLSALKGVDRAAIIRKYDQTSLSAGVERSPLLVDGYDGTADVVVAARMTVRWSAGHHGPLRRGEVLVGASIAGQAGLAALSLRPVVFIDSLPFEVAGLIEDSPRVPGLLGGVLLSDEDARALQGLSKETALILATAGAAQQVATQAPLVIDPYAPSALTVSAPVDPRSLRSEIEADVQSTLLAFTGLALLAALAGLTNAMVLAVIERKQEFGMRLAIGARRFHITGLVFTEAVLIGVFGGLGGLATGLAGILVVTISQNWQPVFDPVLAPVALVGGVAVGAVGGLLAAARAARILPGDALRL